MTKSLLLVSALTAACDTGSLPPAVAPGPEPSVIVATFMNPSLTTDQTLDRISTLFLIERIEWSAVGSLGYTLHVQASRADRARELLRAVPNVDVL